MVSLKDFDASEEQSINLLIDRRLGKQPKRRPGSATKARADTTAKTPVSLIKAGNFTERRQSAASRLSTRGLNRVLGRVLQQTGLSAVGNVFAGGFAAAAVPLVSGAIGFGNALMQNTLNTIEQRKKTIGIFSIPTVPSVGDILKAGLEDGGLAAADKILLKAAHGKRGITGALTGLFSFTKSLLDRNNLDRALEDGQQDFWRNQPVPHTEVLNAALHVKARFNRNFELGRDDFGGWKELPITGN